MSNQVVLAIEKGRHRIGVVYRLENENMNIERNFVLLDNLRLEKR